MAMGEDALRALCGFVVEAVRIPMTWTWMPSSCTVSW
ncbi:hypothetical protein ACIPYS_20790 [Kitasatospora sp. NPDC089913]